MQPQKDQNWTNLDWTTGCSVSHLRWKDRGLRTSFNWFQTKPVWLKCAHKKYLQNKSKIIENDEDLTEILNFY